jgi:hypothetical protein
MELKTEQKIFCYCKRSQESKISDILVNLKPRRGFIIVVITRTES